MNALLATVILVGQDSFDHMGNWGAGWWVLMMVGMVIFWGLVILGIVWLVRELGGHGSGVRGQRERGALEILDQKLAEGSISVEDYQERRRILTGESDRS